MLAAETTRTAVNVIVTDTRLLFWAGVCVGIALVAGWVTQQILGWISHKCGQSPIAQAAIKSAGQALLVLTPAYTIYFFYQDISAAKLIPVEHVSKASKLVSLIVWGANFITLYHFVAWPMAWAKKIVRKTDNKLDDVLVPMLRTAARVLVVILAIIKAVAIIDPTMVNAFIALLGSGGLAIGLASQDTLKNTFGAIMLIVDQPFILGDLINIGSHEGHVESLGLRSTTLVLLDGQRLTIPNSDLANRPIVNVTRRDFIRAQDIIHLEINTTAEQANEALKIVRELLSNHEGFDPRHPPMAHISEFSEWAVNLRLIYWYYPANPAKQLEYNQQLLVRIIERIRTAGIRIASLGTPQPLPHS